MDLIVIVYGHLLHFLLLKFVFMVRYVLVRSSCMILCISLFSRRKLPFRTTPSHTISNTQTIPQHQYPVPLARRCGETLVSGEAAGGPLATWRLSWAPGVGPYRRTRTSQLDRRITLLLYASNMWFMCIIHAHLTHHRGLMDAIGRSA